MVKQRNRRRKATATLPKNPRPPAGLDADVFIQAGHENTPDNKTGGEGPLGNEIDWTPIVADEATRILRQAGVSTIREDASLKRPEQAEPAISCPDRGISALRRSRRR